MGRRRARRHLDSIASLLRRERADVAALQEVDLDALWSGRFDHARYLAERAALPSAVAGAHVQGPALRYGTALLAGDELRDGRSVRFAPAAPLPRKGLVVATLCWAGLELDLVSLHLDPLRRVVRARQLARLIEVLAPGRPRIVMGDFNCEWRPGSAVQRAAQLLGLRAHAPEAPMVTYPGRGARLDWILASPELAFVDCRALDDKVSDHRAVVAHLRRA